MVAGARVPGCSHFVVWTNSLKIDFPGFCATRIRQVAPASKMTNGLFARDRIILFSSWFGYGFGWLGERFLHFSGNHLSKCLLLLDCRRANLPEKTSFQIANGLVAWAQHNLSLRAPGALKMQFRVVRRICLQLQRQPHEDTNQRQPLQRRISCHFRWRNGFPRISRVYICLSRCSHVHMQRAPEVAALRTCTFITRCTDDRKKINIEKSETKFLSILHGKFVSEWKKEFPVATLRQRLRFATTTTTKWQKN